MKMLLAIAVLCLLASPVVAQERAFSAGGPTVSLAVTGTTGRVQVQPGPGNAHMRVYNSGTVAVFLACGDVTVTAALASAMPVAPGTIEVIGCSQTYVAGISSGTATVYITPGSGI
jgi:predicted S18 family serine protease